MFGQREMRPEEFMRGRITAALKPWFGDEPADAVELGCAVEAVEGVVHAAPVDAVKWIGDAAGHDGPTKVAVLISALGKLRRNAERRLTSKERAAKEKKRNYMRTYMAERAAKRRAAAKANGVT